MEAVQQVFDLTNIIFGQNVFCANFPAQLLQQHISLLMADKLSFFSAQVTLSVVLPPQGSLKAVRSNPARAVAFIRIIFSVSLKSQKI
jgi:hypothetical protein